MILKRIYRTARKFTREMAYRMKKRVPVYVPTVQGEFLKGRTAIVTGGTKGIGFEIARAFLLNGATVLITGRSRERIESACAELRKSAKEGEDVFGLEMDSSDCKSFEAKFKEIIGMLGGRKPDIIVNNAGINVHKDFWDFTEDDFDSVMATNLKGVFFLSRLFAKYMRENKIKGNILNVASSSSLRPGTTPYTLSKWGIRSLTLGLARLLVGDGITVNAVAPGPTYTPMHVGDTIHKWGGGVCDLNEYSMPPGRMASPEEIANLATFLVSGMGKMIIGDTVYMTGGVAVVTYEA